MAHVIHQIQSISPMRSIYENMFRSFAARRGSCDYGEWGPWRECQPKCGDGTQYRQRYLKNGDAMNKQCNEVAYDTRNCRTECEEEEATGERAICFRPSVRFSPFILNVPFRLV